MKYGSVPVTEALGAILAHTLKIKGEKPIRKGTKLGESEIKRIGDAGIAEILAARLESGDVGENKAASRIASTLTGANIRAEPAATGRVNLYATTNGLFSAERALIDQLNRIDPGITFATLDQLVQVNSGRMVATVKIIPYAISHESVAEAVALAENAQLIAVEPYAAKRIGVVATQLPQLKPATMDKTIRVLEQRLEISGSKISREIRTGHTSPEIGEAIDALLPQSDMVLVYGASAICDIDDVIPAAIRDLGGEIEHFGMPVDPGNLLLIGEIAGKPVIGAPGCARSPAENGFDWVLQRLLAGRTVSADEVTGMGVGGLLMEIGGRPQPRELTAKPMENVAVVLLAAGQSRRMGSTNKLTADLNGKPMVRHAAEAANASKASHTLVVTGHEAESVKMALAGLDLNLTENPDYQDGLSTSLAAGIRSLPQECDAALILLGDMPGVTGEMIDRMIETARASPNGSIILATFDGKRGNPVLWPRSMFEALTLISGDVGARHLLGEHAGHLVTVELGPAAGFDVDTPEILAAAQMR